MGFDQIADKMLAVAVLAMLFHRQVRAAIVLAFGLPLAVVLWLTKAHRVARERRSGRPWRVYR